MAYRFDLDRPFVHWLLGLAAVGCGMSCLQDPSSTGPVAVEADVQALTATSVTLRTPKGVSPLDVTVGADGLLDVASSAQITAGSSRALAENTGTNATTIQLGARVGNVTSIAPVTVFPLGVVQGDLVGPNLTVLGTVQGTIDRTRVLTPATETTFQIAVPTAASPANVTVGLGTRTLAPGRYGTVQVLLGGTLKLSAGVYAFNDLVLSAGGNLALPDDGRPATIVTTRVSSFAGALTNVGSGPGLTLVQTGSNNLLLVTQFQGLLVATSADVTFGVTTQPHRATVFAKNVHLSALARLDRLTPGALIPLLQPPSGDLQACVEAVRARAELQGTAQQKAYQADIGRWCTDQDTSACLLDIKARVTLDYTAAAGALAAQQKSPAQYLAVDRDRDRKLHALQANPTRASALCNGADDDGDLIPNTSDTCPNTPALTPTDDNGCTVSTLPPAPSAADVANLLQSMGIAYDSACSGAKVLPSISPGGFYLPSDVGLGAFIFAGRVTNQPAGCHVWYVFDIEDISPSSSPAGYQINRSYRVAYLDTEEVTSFVGLPQPVPAGFIQFNAKASDPGSRGQLGQAAGTTSIRFRLKVMNGGGMQSPWSSWKITNSSDCAQLGIFCP